MDKKNIHKLVVDMINTDYEKLKAFAVSTGRTVRGVVTIAVREFLERENGKN